MKVKELKDVVYGPYERNVLDAYLLEDLDAPAPAVVYFHGGGYVNGDKSSGMTAAFRDELLAAGISVISCNYRFISKDPFPAPMEDGTRAIQFVRYMAQEWGINPDQIASSGGSAGGHIALWNALKGDSSKPGSDDPVERQPSTVSAMVGFATQASKDQRFYEGIYDGPHIQPNLALYYGVSSLDELETPEGRELCRRASAISYVSEAAPPIFLQYNVPFSEKIPTDAPVGDVIHHPVHGLVLKQRLEEIGRTCVLRHSANPLQPGEIVKFLLDSFGR